MTSDDDGDADDGELSRRAAAARDQLLRLLDRYDDEE